MPELAKEDIRTELRRLVAANYLEEATDQLLAATAGEEYGAFRSKVVHQSGQLNAYLDHDMMNTEDYRTLAVTRNQISAGLLELIDDLPDAAALSAREKAPEGVSEHKLKRRLFWMLLIGKIIVLALVIFYADTGATLNSESFFTVLGILIPMFGAYLAIMLQNDTDNRRILKPEDIRVTADFARKAYLIVGVYPIIMCLILTLREVGVINSTAMLTVALGLTESGWGAYVGKIIFGLFRAGRG